MKRHVCTKEKPYDITKHKHGCIHPDAVELSGHIIQNLYYSIKYKCPHCKTVFKQELPN